MSKILIVEDSISARAQIEMMLAELNHQLVGVSNGREALDLLKKENDFDLIITDIFMPEMDGIETIEKAIEFCPQTRIIAISAGGMGLSGAGMLEIASGLGARAVLHKPFAAEEFRQTVREVLLC
ncbi:MAG: response regulator [Methylacidiphilales bacterium]|nr:response regulator [Candidatus Methylacidiphilales bacterium]